MAGYQRLPPEREVAMKLAKYFLVQGEFNSFESNVRPKRQVETPRRMFPYDVLFIIDSSGSIRRKDFRKGISALIGLIPRARPDTIYASLTFSTAASIDFLFKDGGQASE